MGDLKTSLSPKILERHQQISVSYKKHNSLNTENSSSYSVHNIIFSHLLYKK